MLLESSQPSSANVHFLAEAKKKNKCFYSLATMSQVDDCRSVDNNQPTNPRRTKKRTKCKIRYSLGLIMAHMVVS